MQPDLFTYNKKNHDNRYTNNNNKTHLKIPLSHKMLPASFEEFIGHQEVLKKFLFITNININIPSLIITGPPGSGKTTLANLIAKHHNLDIYKFNAVLGGLADLKKIIVRALEMKQSFSKSPLIFIDEIHRFNKAQQDALLPYVENGSFLFIGATTENPRVSINNALLSRVQVINLQKLPAQNIKSILNNTIQKLSQEKNNLLSQYLSSYLISEKEDIIAKAIDIISNNVDGDARSAHNFLELFLSSSNASLDNLKQIIQSQNKSYDKNGDQHYRVISKFIKSMRDGNQKDAILALAVMIEGGEDPIFIARRMFIFASEDVGNADPQALLMASSAMHAVSTIGLPECAINLSQVCLYLTSAPKNKQAYLKIKNSLDYVKSKASITFN